MRGVTRVLALAALLAGCSREPEVVPVAALEFPVVLITGSATASSVYHRADVVANGQGLSRMRVGRFTSLPDAAMEDPPVVIDSTAAIFEMTDIEGEHGGLWMMANPTGMIPIRFRLVRREPSGIAAARVLLGHCDYLGRDLDDDRRKQRVARIRQAGTMAEIMRIVDELPAAEAPGQAVPPQSSP